MSTLLTRYLVPFIEEDLKERMVFLGGPRRVGKTYLAQSLIKDYKDKHPAYLNWDFQDHQDRIKNRLKRFGKCARLRQNSITRRRITSSNCFASFLQSTC